MTRILEKTPWRMVARPPLVWEVKRVDHTPTGVTKVVVLPTGRPNFQVGREVEETDSSDPLYQAA